MTTNDSKSYLSYLNKLVDQGNNTFHHSINKTPIDADYSVWLKNLKPILKVLSLNLIIESELLNIIMFLVKVILRIGQEKY